MRQGTIPLLGALLVLGASCARVNDETGEILFDDELTPPQPRSESETGHSPQREHRGGTWIEPQADQPGEPTGQQ